MMTHALSRNGPNSGSFCVGMGFHLGLILYCTRLGVDKNLFLDYNISKGGDEVMNNDTHKFVQKILQCPECGGCQIIHRSKGRNRPQGHIKDIWGFRCKKVTKHKEIGIA